MPPPFAFKAGTKFSFLFFIQSQTGLPSYRQRTLWRMPTNQQLTNKSKSRSYRHNYVEVTCIDKARRKSICLENLCEVEKVINSFYSLGNHHSLAKAGLVQRSVLAGPAVSPSLHPMGLFYVRSVCPKICFSPGEPPSFPIQSNVYSSSIPI